MPQKFTTKTGTIVDFMRGAFSDHTPILLIRDAVQKPALPYALKLNENDLLIFVQSAKGQLARRDFNDLAVEGYQQQQRLVAIVRKIKEQVRRQQANPPVDKGPKYTANDGLFLKQTLEHNSLFRRVDADTWATILNKKLSIDDLALKVERANCYRLLMELLSARYLNREDMEPIPVAFDTKPGIDESELLGIPTICKIQINA